MTPPTPQQALVLTTARAMYLAADGVPPTQRNGQRRGRFGGSAGSCGSFLSSHSLTAASTMRVSEGLSGCRSLNRSIRSIVGVLSRKLVCCVGSVVSRRAIGTNGNAEVKHVIEFPPNIFTLTCNPIQTRVGLQALTPRAGEVAGGGAFHAG
jgi:hypothetical protein